MEIYLYGGGGHAKVIADILKCQNRAVTAVMDDRVGAASVLGLPIMPGSELMAISPLESQWIVAIGDNAARQKVAQRLAGAGYQFTVAIHPSAQISESVTVGAGSVVMPNAVINVDAVIGEHSIINTGATVDHDCRIADYVHVAPACALCGGVKLQEGAFVGVGTRAIPGVSIGRWAVCGAGSVVLKDLPSDTVAYGVPATPRIFG